MADAEIAKMHIIYDKYCIVHVSETNEARDMVFGTGTPWDQENKMFQLESY